MNGTFVLPQPLQARVGTGAFGNVGSPAAPLSLRSWSGPVSNDAVAVDFSQAVNAGDVLRTGRYSKTLTFTLVTTNPWAALSSARSASRGGPSPEWPCRNRASGCGPDERGAVGCRALRDRPTGEA